MFPYSLIQKVKVCLFPHLPKAQVKKTLKKGRVNGKSMTVYENYLASELSISKNL